jgi:hypothetical protein
MDKIFILTNNLNNIPMICIFNKQSTQRSMINAQTFLSQISKQHDSSFKRTHIIFLFADDADVTQRHESRLDHTNSVYPSTLSIQPPTHPPLRLTFPHIGGKFSASIIDVFCLRSERANGGEGGGGWRRAAAFFYQICEYTDRQKDVHTHIDIRVQG